MACTKSMLCPPNCFVIIHGFYMYEVSTSSLFLCISISTVAVLGLKPFFLLSLFQMLSFSLYTALDIFLHFLWVFFVIFMKKACCVSRTVCDISWLLHEVPASFIHNIIEYYLKWYYDQKKNQFLFFFGFQNYVNFNTTIPCNWPKI